MRELLAVSTFVQFEPLHTKTDTRFYVNTLRAEFLKIY
jgi:hypothetical protein